MTLKSYKVINRCCRSLCWYEYSRLHTHRALLGSLHHNLLAVAFLRDNYIYLWLYEYLSIGSYEHYIHRYSCQHVLQMTNLVSIIFRMIGVCMCVKWRIKWYILVHVKKIHVYLGFLEWFLEIKITNIIKMCI